jgi:hypothetical protein
MNNIDLQYLSDTILIERVAALEFGLVKQAGLFDSLNLSGVASSVKNFVTSHVTNDAPGGYVGSVLALMAPSVLWRINPFVGILYLVASQFGFDIQSVISKIVAAIRPKLEKGLPISADEITNIGKSIVAQHIGGEATAAPDDLFEPLRKLSNEDLNKLAASGDALEPLRALLSGNSPGGASGSLPKTPLLSGGDGSLIQRVFGQLFSAPRTAGKGKWLLGGFVIWIIKTILVGAGLLAGAEAISGMLGHKKPVSDTKSKPQSDEHDGHTDSETPSATPATPVAPVASQTPGAQSNELWVVPLVGNGTVEDTLVTWALDLYPNLVHYDNIEQTIESNPAFAATAAFLKKDPRKLGTRTMVMPQTFSSRKQVVDTFIDDVIRNLK